eukprot:211746-Rhodomonas_salina.2
MKQSDNKATCLRSESGTAGDALGPQRRVVVHTHVTGRYRILDTVCGLVLSSILSASCCMVVPPFLLLSLPSLPLSPPPPSSFPI